MIAKLTWRILTGTDPRLIASLAWNFALKGVIGIERFRRRVNRGGMFPAFIFISVTDACNLRCRGCWAVGQPGADKRELTVRDMDRIINEGKKHGCYFYGILGGEPLMHDKIWDVISRHRDCYFQVFTNGLLLDDAAARTMRRLGNVTPLISMEGIGKTADERRRGCGVHDRALAAIGNCLESRLFTGVATSLCASNIDEMLCEELLDELISLGVHYVWYYIYRPVGADPSEELALSAEQIFRAREFIVEMRCKKPIVIVDSYWDAEGGALCPAAVGISHHVGPAGDIEPCPPIQLADVNIRDGKISELFDNSQWLKEFRRSTADATTGCIIMEDPQLLLTLADKCSARDTSGRATVRDEIKKMKIFPSHLSAANIPEKHWMYKFAKKHWFFGFGAYG